MREGSAAAAHCALSRIPCKSSTSPSGTLRACCALLRPVASRALPYRPLSGPGRGDRRGGVLRAAALFSWMRSSALMPTDARCGRTARVWAQNCARPLRPHSSRGVPQTPATEVVVHARTGAGHAGGLAPGRRPGDGKKREPQALQAQAGGHADDVSPRAPSCVSSLLLSRSRPLLAVRHLLIGIRDHYQPAPAAAVQCSVSSASDEP
jgi:hypothetical protein